jgi:hypothetical protein
VNGVARTSQEPREQLQRVGVVFDNQDRAPAAVVFPAGRVRGCDWCRRHDRVPCDPPTHPRARVRLGTRMQKHGRGRIIEQSCR